MIGRRLWSNQGEELSPLLFTFDNVGGQITVPTNVVPDLVFSFDLGEWTDVVKGTAITVPGKTIYFKIKRGKAGGLYSSSTYSNRWIIYGAVKASGNIMSLLGQSGIGLETFAFSSMFSDCTSLTTAPELPATVLADYCYYGMFNGCTSLTTAPELPAATLASYCYYYMFYGCNKINYIQCLANENVGLLSSTNNWVKNVSASGTFVKKTGVTWPTGISGIPSGWTIVEN